MIGRSFSGGDQASRRFLGPPFRSRWRLPFSLFSLSPSPTMQISSRPPTDHAEVGGGTLTSVLLFGDILTCVDKQEIGNNFDPHAL